MAILATSSGATAVAAQTYPPSAGPTASVLGEGGSNVDGSGTAFTGGDLTVTLLVIGVLLGLGIVALLLARRRSGVE
jgi:hypothetical protein